MGAIFVVSIEFVTVLLRFYGFFFFFLPWSMWDLSCPTRDGTSIPCIEKWSPNY